MILGVSDKQGYPFWGVPLRGFYFVWGVTGGNPPPPYFGKYPFGMQGHVKTHSASCGPPSLG